MTNKEKYEMWKKAAEMMLADQKIIHTVCYTLQAKFPYSWGRI
jgi:hypothetical protein